MRHAVLVPPSREGQQIGDREPLPHVLTIHDGPAQQFERDDRLQIAIAHRRPRLAQACGDRARTEAQCVTLLAISVPVPEERVDGGAIVSPLDELLPVVAPAFAAKAPRRIEAGKPRLDPRLRGIHILEQLSRIEGRLGHPLAEEFPSRGRDDRGDANLSAMQAGRRPGLGAMNVEHVADQMLHARERRARPADASDDPAHRQRGGEAPNPLDIAFPDASCPFFDALSAQREEFHQRRGEGAVDPTFRGQKPVARRAVHRQQFAEARSVENVRGLGNRSAVRQDHVRPARQQRALDAFLQHNREIVGEAVDRGRGLYDDMHGRRISHRGDLGDVGDRPPADRDDAVRTPTRRRGAILYGFVGVQRRMAVAQGDAFDREAFRQPRKHEILEVSAVALDRDRIGDHVDATLRGCIAADSGKLTFDRRD